MESYTIDPTTQCDNSLKALVRFHGGGFTEGEAEASMRPFFLELALKHGAVILAPDYRLRPEHEMTDVIEDIRCFWRWVEWDAQRILRESLQDIELDVTNLLVGGESAGGYLTMQTALLGMTGLPIKVLFVQYPAPDMAGILGLADESHQPGAETSVLFSAKHSFSVVEDHLAALEPGKICTRAKFGARMHLLSAMLQARRFCDLSGDNAYIDPMTSLETAGKLPPILLYHSKDDEMVSD
ncbi:hypothetical protein DL766_004384 [Monosporascus sp. MC13-8B]|uniref:Alpha/beta hydrolase fold-3 domain-containing protein n=1 Tax=Monosporascus cannonballus TaxID=155416 RepID=A0ABY0HEL3_9PEZI|nr:hypothetical protein DL762_002033 [Monosporascus cannonballus]RYO97521.1 hypothetical protein DL763_002721 [Monosporascus cannonballus]RYP31409.1 hypothetical protein DL766_004384 [Monosporascus sp. MC13-8B]